MVPRAISNAAILLGITILLCFFFEADKPQLRATDMNSFYTNVVGFLNEHCAAYNNEIIMRHISECNAVR